MKDSLNFVKALKANDLDTLRKIPKADLHNHFVLGGDRHYINKISGYKIEPLKKPIGSMNAMHRWNKRNIGKLFDNPAMRRLLIDAAFVQAKLDGVTVLEIGEDVWALKEYYNNDVDELINAFETPHNRIAPEIELRLVIGMSRHCNIDYLKQSIAPFLNKSEFYSVDLYGGESAQPIENFIPIYKKAKDCGLRLKAHVGEWGTAEDVINAIKALNLDEVQHGISAYSSVAAIEYLVQNNIRLNITPTSNLMLKRVKSIGIHPIAALFRAGVEVTINSDDVLIFGSDVSKEYLSLYNSNSLTAEELNAIRVNGLKRK